MRDMALGGLLALGGSPAGAVGPKRRTSVGGPRIPRGDPPTQGWPDDSAESGVSRPAGVPARTGRRRPGRYHLAPGYGGRGLPGRFQRIFDSEAAAYQLPPRALEIGIGMCGPTVLAHGTEAQKRALIPPLLRGNHVGASCSANLVPDPTSPSRSDPGPA